MSNEEDFKEENSHKEFHHGRPDHGLSHTGKELPRCTLDLLFSNGKKPDGENFASIFASSLNIKDDGITPKVNEKGSFVLENRKGDALKLSPGEISRTRGSGLLLSAGDGVPVTLNKMALKKSEETTVDRITTHIDSSGHDDQDDVTLPTVSAVKKYSGSQGVDYPGVTSQGEGSLQLKDRKQKTLELSPDEISSDATGGLRISNKHGIDLDAKNNPVTINQLEINQVTIDQISTNLSKDSSPTTSLATADAITAYVDAQTPSYETLSLMLAGFNCIVTDIPGFQLPDSLGVQVYSTIQDALDNTPQPAIFVSSQSGQWKEQFSVTKDARIVFAENMLLTLPDSPNSNTPLITITGTQSTPVSAEICCDIDGTNAVQGVSAQYANLKFTGNIKKCYTQSNGGGVSLDSCPEVVITGNISGCTAEQYGGGVAVTNSAQCSINGNITGCTAKASGGGIVITNEGIGNMTGDITGCKAENGYGGGAHIGTKAKYTLDGNIIECSATKGNAAEGGDGGGITIHQDAKVSITGNISECTATNNGGGVSVNTRGQCSINGSISGCTATNNGSGVSVKNSGTGTTTGEITGNISECSATGGGGGIYIYNSGEGSTTGEITGSINECSAGSGGGIYIYNTGTGSATGNMTGDIIDCEARNNSGGGIYINRKNNGSARGNMTGNIIRCTAKNGGGVLINGDSAMYTLSGNISECTASSGGGGIYITDSAQGSFNGNISECEATSENGGGIFIGNSSQGQVTGNITECKADQGYGGGVYIENGECYLTGNVIECSAQRGGGIRNDGGQCCSTGEIIGCTASVNGGGIYAIHNSKSYACGNMVGCTADDQGNFLYATTGSGTTIFYKGYIIGEDGQPITGHDETNVHAGSGTSITIS